MMATESADPTVAELATTHPAATRVLYRLGIEFCVGGSRRLSAACRDAAVEVAGLLAEVEREEALDPGVAWAERPLAELVDHILEAFHAVERRELDLVLDRLRTTAAVTSQSAGAALATACGQLRDDLTDHMAKEETVLFPWIRSGRGAHARTPVQVMMMEHDATLRLLNQVRDLGQALTAAAPAATEIVSRLAEIDRHIREHMHLENNVLFPRALRGEE